MAVDLNDFTKLKHLGFLAERTAKTVGKKLDKASGTTIGNVSVFASSDGSIANSTIVGGDILTKIAGATAGNVPVFTSDGKIADSTFGIATDEEVNEMLDEILPTVSGA